MTLFDKPEEEAAKALIAQGYRYIPSKQAGGVEQLERPGDRAWIGKGFWCEELARVHKEQA